LVSLTLYYSDCDNVIAPNGTDSSNNPYNFGIKDPDDSKCSQSCRVPTGSAASTEACGFTVDAPAGYRISLYLAANYVPPAVSPRFPMNACVPMLKIVLLCNAICRDFSNRRRFSSDVGTGALVAPVDGKMAQEVVKDERRRAGRVLMVDPGRMMGEMDVGTGIWDCGSGLLRKARQEWLAVVTEVLYAGLHHCLQAVAAYQIYNANHDDTTAYVLLTPLWSDHPLVLMFSSSEGSTLYLCCWHP
jgi:hypothetical protein